MHKRGSTFAAMPAPLKAAVILRALICAGLLAAAAVAQAGCLTGPTAELEALSDRIGRDPDAIVRETGRNSAADWAVEGWRQAVRAEAFDMLSRPADARKVTELAMAKTPDRRSPLYIELLTLHALNGYREEEIDASMPVLEAARRQHRKGSLTAICLGIALGELQRMRHLPDRAVVSLTDAYRATAEAPLERQHVLAAFLLARVMGWAGDYAQAISLIDEVAVWDRDHGRLYALANDLYFRGRFRLDKGDYRAALADFERSRRLGATFNDPMGFAYIDLQSCTALVGLGRFDHAETYCRRAAQVFRLYHDDGIGQASLQLARIDFALGRATLARKRLDRLLASDLARSATVATERAYKLRADVRRSLGDRAGAYDDLAAYIQMRDTRLGDEQSKQSAVLRASFEADREALRNRELSRNLLFAKERAREQDRRYSMLSFLSAAGIALVVVVTLMGVFHRRKLARLADTDGLTGLLNRRSITHRARSIVAAHARSGLPLTLVIIDIDHFKNINDTYGHDVGDAVLIGFADRAKASLRKTDLLARWGGEEFILLFPGTELSAALQTLQRLRSIMARDEIPSGIRVRFSAGATTLRRDRSFEALVTAADAALYEAKRRGRDAIVIAEGDGSLSAPHKPETMDLFPTDDATGETSDCKV